MAFVFKVMTLAIRTASKPLANRFQSYVLSHPTLRPAVLKFAQPEMTHTLIQIEPLDGSSAGCVTMILYLLEGVTDQYGFYSGRMAQRRLEQEVGIVQGIHAAEFAMNRLSEGKPISGTGKKFVARLDDDRALDLAGKFVSEGFVLAVAVGVLYWDMQRSSAKEEVKKANELEYRAGVDGHFSEIKHKIDRQSQHAEEIFRALRKRQDLFDRQLQELQHERENSGWWSWGTKEKAD